MPYPPIRVRSQRWWMAPGVRLVSSRLGGRFMTTIAPAIDRRLIPLTRGRVKVAPGVPQGILHTTGAKTGAPRAAPVVYLDFGDFVSVIASNGGRPTTPAWYHNLRAHPDCELEMDGERRSFTARISEGDERDHIWSEAIRVYRGWVRYQRHTGGREIPVLVLEPRV